MKNKEAAAGKGGKWRDEANHNRGGANEALEDLSGKHGIMVVAKSVYPTEKNEPNEQKLHSHFGSTSKPFLALQQRLFSDS